MSATKRRAQSNKKIYPPILSIVIPAYNAEKSLKKCLQSIMKQSFKNFEVIVVDNNSTDKTKEIINEFSKKDKRIKYAFEHFRSRGAARNAGIKVSRGEIIVNTNCDSIVPSNWLEKFVSTFNSEVNAVQGNEKASVSNFWVKEYLKSTQEFRTRKFSKTEKGYIDLVDFENFALRKLIFKTIGFYDVSLKNLEDIDFRLRLKQADIKIRYLKDCFVYQNPPFNFKKVFSKSFDRGFWIKKVFEKNKSYISKSTEEEFQALELKGFASFFLTIPICFWRKGLKRGFYELVTGTAWRLGILKGRYH